MINQIVNKPDPNTQNPDVLEQTINNFINTDLPLFIEEANATATDISDKHSEILTKASLVDGWNTNVNTKYTEILGYADATLQYRNDALAAKQTIESYVVPTNATYTPAEIDDKNETQNLEQFLGFTF